MSAFWSRLNSSVALRILVLVLGMWVGGALRAETKRVWSDWFVLRENILARMCIEQVEEGFVGSRWQFRVDPARLQEVPDLASQAIYLTYHQTFPPRAVGSRGSLEAGKFVRRVYFPAGEHRTSVHHEGELLWFPMDYENPHEKITWRPGNLLPIVETPSNGRKGPNFGPILDGIEVNSERLLRFSQERFEKARYESYNYPPHEDDPHRSRQAP